MHVASRSLIKVPDRDQLAECVPETMRKHHTWFLERDDTGYRFKHCKFGNYLGLNESHPAFACTSNLPVVWKIYFFGSADTYILQPVGQSGVLERSDQSGPDGNSLIDICSKWDVFRLAGHQGWRLELVSTERGTDALAEEISNHKQELLNAYRDLSACQSTLLQRELTIQNMAQELRQKDTEIEDLKRQIRQNREAERGNRPRPRNMT
ncbi:hypothetical protein FRC08_015494 [Ceratobasidium sp. 394]|nr:hypothetical protein FRC08_015494 [Ceratobasidium sp. 394]